MKYSMNKDTKSDYMDRKIYKVKDRMGQSHNAINAKMENGLLHVITDKGESRMIGDFFVSSGDMVRFICEVANPIVHGD